jgi:ribonuclease HI
MKDGRFQPERGALVWYTDGSKMKEGVGAGVYGPNCRISKPLGKTPSIFQAEVHAIELCASESAKKGLRGANIYILSDSQAALKALAAFKFDSKLAWECRKSLNQLANHNRVTLMWVPGHEGVEGNEIADQLAREGAQAPFYGPEPFCGTSKAHLYEELKRWEKSEKESYWRYTQGQRQAKNFISHSPKYTEKLMKLSRNDLRIITCALTGHGPWRYCLKKMGKAEDENCRFCITASETAEHILCNCEVLTRSRLKYLGGINTEPHEILQTSPQSILGFIKSLNIFG